MVVSTALMAQRHDTPWQINAGLNAVDIFPTGKENIYFPNQGGFFEDFTNTDHWNAGVPSIGVYRTLKENLSVGVNFAFAGVSKIEGATNRNLQYISSDVQLKYAFLRSKHLSPYARLGAGISSFNDASISNNITAEKRSAGHWVGSIGLDLLLTNKFGFYVETNFKSAFGDQGIPHFNHSIGFSYGLGVLDRDGDGTPDSEDECIDEPGIASLNGCPDRDGDGIKDSEDQCPYTPGIKEFMGCPDTDMDGIQDKEDDCPEEAGPVENNGCPFQDVDGDGVFDKDDACPAEDGPVENNGCPWPDTDGDGVLDKDDVCPELAGTAENNGCPDQDGDGVIDPDDECIDEAGPSSNNGFPWPDTDGDGVFDKDDDCPTQAGNSATGCPVVEKTIIEALNSAGVNILFPADGFELKGTKVLDAVAKVQKILEDNPDGIVLVQGYASEDGSNAYNQELSQKRAEAVKAKLIELGIPSARLEVQAFGESRPIVDKNEALSRAKSRRVEFTAKQ